MKFFSDDEAGFVSGNAFNNHVDNLALDVDEDDGIDGQTDVAEGHEGGQRDTAVDNQHQYTERYLCVFVNDHGNDITAARGSSSFENQTDGYTVNQTGDHGVEEEVGHEVFGDGIVAGTHFIREITVKPFAAVEESVMDKWRIAPDAFHNIGEYGYEDDRYDGLDAKTRTQEPGAD